MTGRQPMDVAPEAIVKIRELFMAGEGERAIGRAVGLSHGVVRRRLAPIIRELKAKGQMLPVAKSGPKPRVTPDIRAQMVEMLKAGETVAQIARTVQIPKATVRENLKPELDELRSRGPDWWRPPATLDKRAAIVAAIMGGVPFEEIGQRFGMTGANARGYVRHMTPEQVERSKHLRRAKSLRGTPASATRPERDKVYAKLSAAMPGWLSDASREDALSDLYVAYLEGRLPTDVAGEAKRYANRMVAAFESKFGPRSLDERLFDDSDMTFGETLVDPAALDAFDYIFEEAR